MVETKDEILIADDEEAICFSLARAVQGHGLTPRVVPDGRTAVEAFTLYRQRIRGVFLDVHMPRLGGIASLHQLRSIDPQVPCCLMTAYLQDAEAEHDRDHSQVHCLQKPFDLATFGEVLAAMLSHPRSPDAKPRAERLRIALTFPPRYAMCGDVVRGAMRYARSGQNWIVSVHQEEEIDATLAGDPDGVIGMVWSEDTARKLRAWGGPVVDTGPNFPDGVFARVGLADKAVGAAAADHLLTLGSRHLAVFPQPAIPALGLFKNGFLTRLAEVGTDAEIAPAEQFDWPTPTSVPQLDAVTDWIRRLPLPAAVFAVTDQLALRISEACRVVGLRVPEDVAVLGALNDPVVCESGDPPLSSVRPASEAVGFEAARVLARMLQGEPAPTRRIEFPPTGIAVRRSTDVTACTDPDLAVALMFLRSHYAEEISVEDVVEAAMISRSSLERRFRAAFGHGPLTELTRLRIEKAKQLLTETDLSLGAIATACGFREARRLSILFRQKTGVTPKAYRRHFRGN